VGLRDLGGVLRRFRWLVVAGLVGAVVLSVLTTARVTAHGLIYRDSEVWSSTSTLFLSEQGFPWGRVIESATGTYPTLGDRTFVYAAFANSDAIKSALAERGAPKSWKLAAAPVLSTNPYVAPPPVITLEATADSPDGAAKAVKLGSSDIVDYVRSQQSKAGIPVSQRVTIQRLQTATKPIVVKPRKKALTVVVFLASMALTLGLAITLENLRPRKRPEAKVRDLRTPLRESADGLV
jgi:hypothetical protein